jgi:predicted transcriptional regulator
MTATVPVTVRIPVEVNERLEKIAAATQRSKSWLAAEAIGAFVTSESEFLAAVEEGIADARAGRLVEHGRVRRWLLSWGSGKDIPMPKPGRGPRPK